MSTTKKSLGYIILPAHFIFICHFSEEAPGFVAWFNQHVSRGINSGLFWSVNISALVITLFVVLMELMAPSVFSAALIILWLGFLMLANAIFHITGSIADKNYMPGLITAVVLYIPYYFLIARNIVKSHRMKIFPVISIAFLGALPMLIHGYKIIFLGERLF